MSSLEYLSPVKSNHEAQGWLAAQWAHDRIKGESLEHKLLAPWEFVERESSTHLRQSDPMIAEALRCMTERMAEGLTIHEVAHAIHTSKRTLERRFQSVLRHSPAEMMRDLRLKETLVLLADGKNPLKEVCLDAGWSDVSQMELFPGCWATSVFRKRRNSSLRLRGKPSASTCPVATTCCSESSLRTQDGVGWTLTSKINEGDF